MAFNIFGSDKGPVTTNNVTQNVNVGVEVNPYFNFGSQFLQPLADTLGQINGQIVDRFAPLAEGIQGSIENANRLATDLRRTANFSTNPALAQPQPSVSPVLLAALVVGGFFLFKKLA